MTHLAKHLRYAPFGAKAPGFPRQNEPQSLPSRCLQANEGVSTGVSPPEAFAPRCRLTVAWWFCQGPSFAGRRPLPIAASWKRGPRGPRHGISDAGPPHGHAVWQGAAWPSAVVGLESVQPCFLNVTSLPCHPGTLSKMRLLWV